MFIRGGRLSESFQFHRDKHQQPVARRGDDAAIAPCPSRRQ
jgi:hypothetical protein